MVVEFGTLHVPDFISPRIPAYPLPHIAEADHAGANARNPHLELRAAKCHRRLSLDIDELVGLMNH